MTIILLLAAGWLLALVAWVVLKLRQPKLVHPVPPRRADRSSAAVAEEERPASA